MQVSAFKTISTRDVEVLLRRTRVTEDKVSRRKAFQAGERTFVIADEVAKEVYIGIAEIDAEPTPSKPMRAAYLAVVPMGPVLVTLVLSLGAIIAGIVLARVWR
jgi:hypothetical protein